MKAQLQRRFGASVAEVDHHDVWQRARLTLACVAREHRELQGLLDGAERYLAGQAFELGSVEREVMTSMSERMRRVNEALREVLSEGIGELKDPRIGFVTVTGVDASPDLRQATVFVSVLGSEKKREATLAGLESSHGVLQTRVNRELHLKRTPHLTFQYDPTVERGVRLSRLIDELNPDDTTEAAGLAEVAAAIRGHDRFIVTTHENPDGDALGSLLAMTLALRELGKDAVMYLFGEVPIPKRVRVHEARRASRAGRPDSSDRVVVALDCANERRLGPESALLERAQFVIDIDHHHDNSRFGKANLIVGDASSTGEILRDVFRELGVELTPEIAEALYIAVVTDTGRFQYANTSAKALRLAAELVEAGADVHRVFQGVYENVAFAKLKLVARALENAAGVRGRPVIVSHLERKDFAAAGAEEPYSEGIIDWLRAVEGAELAALIREPPTLNGPTHRVSLRTTEEDLDVSAIARKSGGGGHRQAAGFSSESTVEEITEFIRREFLAQVNGQSPG